MKVPKILYDVYSKLNGTNLIKLNLSYCENIKIDLYLPLILDDNIDKYNSSSGYYNDICYTTTSDDGTDIILNDRKNEFIQNNKTVCQENCDFSYYNHDIQKAKCSCDAKKSSFSISNLYINKTEIYKNFIDIKNIANIYILKCYKVLFNIKRLLHNYGCFSLIAIIIIHIILIIYFYGKNAFKTIKSQIIDIAFAIKHSDLIEIEKKETENNERIKTIKQNKKKSNKKNLQNFEKSDNNDKKDNKFKFT